jgi:hypothetical protein
MKAPRCLAARGFLHGTILGFFGLWAFEDLSPKIKDQRLSPKAQFVDEIIS